MIPPAPAAVADCYITPNHATARLTLTDTHKTELIDALRHAERLHIATAKPRVGVRISLGSHALVVRRGVAWDPNPVRAEEIERLLRSWWPAPTAGCLDDALSHALFGDP